MGSNHGRVWQAELATGMAHFSMKWQGSLDMAKDAGRDLKHQQSALQSEHNTQHVILSGRTVKTLCKVIICPAYQKATSCIVNTQGRFVMGHVLFAWLNDFVFSYVISYF